MVHLLEPDRFYVRLLRNISMLQKPVGFIVTLSEFCECFIMRALFSKYKSILPGLLFSLSIVAATGQVKFSALVSEKKISAQDYLQVQFTIENAKQVKQFVPPVFTYFQVLQGPDQASGWSLVNGELKQYITFSYLLKPLRQGKLVLPPATVKADGKLYRSDVLIIEVTNNSNAVSSYGLPEDKTGFDEFILKKGETIQDKINNNLFVKLEVSKTSCYEGQPVVATYKLYTRLKSESRVVKRPSFNGFSVFDMVDPESGNPVKENYKGREYHVYLLRKIQLYPLQSGTLELEPLEVENTVTFVKGEYAGSNNNLSDLLSALVEDQPPVGATVKEKVTLSNKPVSINVKPLPVAGRPGDYSGAVGRFAVVTSLKQPSVHRNDVYNLEVVLKGSGNIPVISAPAINWPASFEAYEPQIKEDVVKAVAPMAGEKVFTIPFSPKQEGDFIIPAVEFSYFDPDSGRYKLAKSDTIKLTVAGEKTPELKNFTENIKAISHNLVERRPLLVYLFAGAALIAVVILVYRYRVKKQKVKRDEAMRKAAERAAAETAFLAAEKTDYLFHARQALYEHQHDKFYKGLSQGLWLFMSEHLHVPLADLNKPLVTAELFKAGTMASVIAEFNAIVTACEDALYTPFTDEMNDEELLARAEALIHELVT
ncbi:MAG: BatD family protein [Chitinophagaceae bacterium]|nr:BatD family protein [Chitinophagaceae bacterium]